MVPGGGGGGDDVGVGALPLGADSEDALNHAAE
jgi:hypothetical protein